MDNFLLKLLFIVGNTVFYGSIRSDIHTYETFLHTYTLIHLFNVLIVKFMYLRTYVFRFTFKKKESVPFCTYVHSKTQFFWFGHLISMPKMAKPKTPEMSSPLREEESEYTNGITHKLNFKSGDCIPTFRFCITHLLFAIFISSSNRRNRCYCGSLSHQTKTNFGRVSVTRWRKYV